MRHSQANAPTIKVYKQNNSFLLACEICHFTVCPFTVCVFNLSPTLIHNTDKYNVHKYDRVCQSQYFILKIVFMMKLTGFSRVSLSDFMSSLTRAPKRLLHSAAETVTSGSCMQAKLHLTLFQISHFSSFLFNNFPSSTFLSLSFYVKELLS